MTDLRWGWSCGPTAFPETDTPFSDIPYDRVLNGVLGLSPTLTSRLSSQFSQCIKTGSTLSDVSENGSGLTVFRLFREFQQDVVPWTVDALRIGKIFMHDLVICVEQFVFGVYSARPS